MTRIALDELRWNPFRDEELYPLDREQVDRLQRFISDDGFFGGVTARPAPDGNGYELAAGHHRIEAAKRAGLTHVEVDVQPYDDLQMVRIMGRENLSQRGHNAAAALDSVAAQARLTAFAVLAAETFEDDGSQLSRILDSCGVVSQKSLDVARGVIPSDGPGARLIYRAINGFDKSERKAEKEKNPNAEHMSEMELQDALKRLKASGYMGKIVGWAQEKASAVLAERREAEDVAAREDEERRKTDEERHAGAAREAAEAVVRTAKAAEEARERAEKAKPADKALAVKDAKAKAAEARKATAEQARLEEERKADAATAAERAKKAAVRRRRREKTDEAMRERAKAVAAQAEREAIYDIQCDQRFKTRAHAQAFMQAVTNDDARRVIPVDKQYGFAGWARWDIDRYEADRNETVGSTHISHYVARLIADAVSEAKDEDRAERQQTLRGSALARVEDHWSKVARHVSAFERQLHHLKRELAEWEHDKAPFPIPAEQLDLMLDALAKVKLLREGTAGGSGGADGEEPFPVRGPEAGPVDA